MPKKLKRYYCRGHFVTRLPLLATVGARNLFVKELDDVRHGYDFLLVGYVLTPNHVHIVISEPKKCFPSSALQMLKQRVSRKMRRQQHVVPLTELRMPAAKHIGELPGFWQARFYDFNVYSHEKKNEKLDYMHRNPLDRELVEHPQDWPWSSWAFYLGSESGLIAMDPVNT